jgi:hypothetical protein
MAYNYQQQYKTQTNDSELEIIPQPGGKDLPIVSVIVTICGGSSYDNIFRQIPQEAPNGRISVYGLNPSSVEKLYNYMQIEKPTVSSEDALFSQLLSEIASVDKDSVLFNWECCSLWGESGNYSFQPTITIEFMGFLLKRGHMVMCSDFAVKALINDWKESKLGPRLFSNVGECDNAIELKFKAQVLKDCPSAQLNIVGDLCPEGKACIHALGGTVVVGLDQALSDTNDFKLNVLTIATNMDYRDGPLAYSIDGQKGTIGHALLEYPSGGILLISAGHWIELSNLNVNIDGLKKVADSYGVKYSAQMESISRMNETEQKVEYQKMAKQFIQQNSACKYSPAPQKRNNKET